MLTSSTRIRNSIVSCCSVSVYNTICFSEKNRKYILQLPQDQVDFSWQNLDCCSRCISNLTTYQRIKYGIVLIIRRSLTRLKAHKMQSPAKGKRELKSLYRSLSARNRSSNQSMKHFQGFSWLRSNQSKCTVTNNYKLSLFVLQIMQAMDEWARDEAMYALVFVSFKQPLSDESR